eukprot:CAMPEP_0115039332 /NCGR_PEP_ID=MMETSP0216-20121206/43963_1 /TAXON_ID=223996 /ORGANISM="Protocruzia adherens, Strain Boccale" /LENGTH=182 /DNA_ID=CAMNT_0002419947 /DNA_START=50 /DNA_END=599 /DNA_ORIENTATION=+
MSFDSIVNNAKICDELESLASDYLLSGGDDEKTEQELLDAGEIKLHPKRWLILGLDGIRPNSNEAKEYYGVSNSEIVFAGTMSMITFFLAGIPVGNFIAKNMRASTLVSVSLMTVGTWIRYVARDSYEWMMVGQFFAANSGLFLLAAPPVIAENWFPEREQKLALSIGVTANYMGTGVAFLE